MHLPADGEPTMKHCWKHLLTFIKQEEGPTAVEYAVMMSLIIVACVATIVTLGTNSNNTYSYVGKKVGRTASS
jgi:pilus assembly protein Flp/PilA